MKISAQNLRLPEFGNQISVHNLHLLISKLETNPLQDTLHSTNMMSYKPMAIISVRLAHFGVRFVPYCGSSSICSRSNAS